MEHRVHLRLSVDCGPRAVRPWLAAALLLLAAGDLASENVTLTTYYPAPSGVYAQMITTGNTYLARDGGAASKVGIGTTSPAAKLDVNGNILLSAASPAIAFNSGGPTVGMAGGNGLAFGTSGLERLRIDGSGLVGVGTASPAYPLDVVGDVRAGGIKGAGCYNLSFSNGGKTSCADTVNERVVSMNYDLNSPLTIGGPVTGPPGTTANAIIIATTGTMMCCRLRP